MDWQQKLRDVTHDLKVQFLRVVKSDFQAIRPTESEVRAMSQSSAAIEHDVSRRVAVWRRSALVFAAALLMITVAIELVTYKTVEDQMVTATRQQFQSHPELLAASSQPLQSTNAQASTNRHAGSNVWAQQQGLQQDSWSSQIDQQPQYATPTIDQQTQAYVDAQVELLGRDNLEILDGIGIFLLFATVVGSILCLLAACWWTDPKRSRRMARIGFLVIFMMPFALALIPFSKLMSFEHLSGQLAGQADQFQQMMGILLGMQFVVLVGPKAIALFIGIVRSSVTLKTLTPESTLPGWTAAIVAPLYSIFVFVLLALVNQTHPDYKLLLGLACIMASPLVFVVRFKDMLAPTTPEDVSQTLSPIKSLSAVFAVVGFVLIGMYIVDLEYFAVEDGITLLLHLAGNMLLMTVVAADVNLALIGLEHRHSHVDDARHCRSSLETRFVQLAADGLTVYDAEPVSRGTDPIEPIDTLAAIQRAPSAVT